MSTPTGTLADLVPANDPICARYAVVKAAERVKSLRRELSMATDELDAAKEAEAVALVEANEVPLPWRNKIATPAMLWEALRDRREVSTGGHDYTKDTGPGDGFMSVTIGLRVWWIPTSHYFKWSEEVRAEREAHKAKEAGK